jgi:hypothetical protein
MKGPTWFVSYQLDVVVIREEFGMVRRSEGAPEVEQDLHQALGIVLVVGMDDPFPYGGISMC